MRKTHCLLATLGALAVATPARAQLSFGVVGPNVKVRPADKPQTTPGAQLKAARNEFEPFQLVLTSATAVKGISVKLSQPLSGPGGAQIPAANVVLYRAAYYDVSTPSNSEGATGPWPDPLIPDVDSYVREQRNAFPFDLPAGKSRVVWVDVLVPMNAAPGDYSGELQIDVGGAKQGVVPVKLRVGNFTLPSTSSLPTAFGFDYAAHCYAHTGFESCSQKWDEQAGTVLRERYVRAALEHRFSVDPFFQPPQVSDANVKLILPLVDGTSKDVRLPGAKLTTIRLDTLNAKEMKQWIDYAKQNGYYERLFYYPVDEPGGAGAWQKFLDEEAKLHSVDPNVPIILTTPIQEADKSGVTDKIDIIVPVINHLEERPKAGTPFDGYQRDKYDPWLQAKPTRRLWSYQSCMSHGCGDCGRPSPDLDDTGWPNRVIDATSVQTRAFPWIAFLFNLQGELYFSVSEQLETAWDKDGQCAFSGSGDGTIYYPGKPSIIGGTTDIPIESIRMKLIREGMEDYEYLLFAARLGEQRARDIAQALFPHPYECNQPATKLEQARDRLFALLDEAGPALPDAGVGPVGDGGGGAADGGPGIGDAKGGNAGDGASTDGGCGCGLGALPAGDGAALLLLLLLLLAGPRLDAQRRGRGRTKAAVRRHHVPSRPRLR